MPSNRRRLEPAPVGNEAFLQESSSGVEGGRIAGRHGLGSGRNGAKRL